MTIFGHFWRLIPHNLGIKNFFGKNKNVPFFVSLLYKSVQKIRKIESVVFKKNKRTYVRTNGDESIGPKSASGGGPKQTDIHCEQSLKEQTHEYVNTHSMKSKEVSLFCFL